MCSSDLWSHEETWPRRGQRSETSDLPSLDPLTLIITALAQGAAKAAGDVVPDAYKSLRHLLQQRCSAQQGPGKALEEHGGCAGRLRQQLERTALAEDHEVLELDRKVLDQLANRPHASCGPVEIGRGAKGVIGQTVSGSGVRLHPAQLWTAARASMASGAAVTTSDA